MNLPETYAAVCAKRPELAVESLKWTEGHTTFYWLFECILVQEEVAAAMILARWVEALPVYHVLAQMLDKQWQVYELGIGGDYTGNGSDLHPTPIEALAAFYLEYAK